MAEWRNEVEQKIPKHLLDKWPAILTYYRTKQQIQIENCIQESKYRRKTFQLRTEQAMLKAGHKFLKIQIGIQSV